MSSLCTLCGGTGAFNAGICPKCGGLVDNPKPFKSAKELKDFLGVPGNVATREEDGSLRPSVPSDFESEPNTYTEEEVSKFREESRRQGMREALEEIRKVGEGKIDSAYAIVHMKIDDMLAQLDAEEGKDA